MKRKTNFKQMYLVDDTLYNRINNVTSQLPSTMIVGRYSQALNSQPIPNESNSKMEESPIQSKIMKSTETMTDTPPTKTSSGMMTDESIQPKIMKSIGIITEAPTTVDVSYQQHKINTLQEQLHNSQLQVRSLENSLHTPSHASQPEYRSLQMDDYSSRMNERRPRIDNRRVRMVDRTPRINYRNPRLNYRTPRIEDRTVQLPPQSEYPTLQYHNSQPPALQMEHANIMLPTIHHESGNSHPMDTLPPQEQAELMDFNTNKAIVYNPSHHGNMQQIAIPSESRYSLPMNTSPTAEQLELMDFNTTKTLEYNAQPETTLALPPSDQLNITNKPIEYQASALALPPPVDECVDCTDKSAITKYVKYNEPGIVALPSVQGLPNSVLFTCTLCNTNFKSQTTLQRHMKNLHDAFNQKEKGSKRKLVDTNIMDTKKGKTNKILRNKAAVSYTKYL